MYSKTFPPSTKEGSIGLELRQALEQLRNLSEQQDALVDDSSLTEKVNDVLLCEDNEEKLKDARILDVVVFEEESKSVQIMCSGRYDEVKVRQTLAELTTDLQLTIRGFETAHSLGFYEPPICITSNAKGSSTGYGTGCVVHNEGGMFGLTAKHVLLGLSSDNEPPRQLTTDQQFSVYARHSSSRSCISGRYHEGNTSIEEIGWFNHSNMHPKQDIAMFYVSVAHGFAVNKFFADKSFTLSCNLLERMVIKVDTKVCKVGVASGTTFGTIKYITPGKPLFHVVTNEVGMFATPGDSGALVVTEDNIAVGMVIEGTLEHTVCLNICMLFGMQSLSNGH
jgi:hypothetical protein